MRRIATVITCFVTLALPGIALAQGSSTCQAYNPQVASSLGCGGKTSPTAPNAMKMAPPRPPVASMKLVSLTTHSKTLPFTGLDVVLLVAGGVTLLGAGLIVRRLSASAKE